MASAAVQPQDGPGVAAPGPPMSPATPTPALGPGPGLGVGHGHGHGPAPAPASASGPRPGPGPGPAPTPPPAPAIAQADGAADVTPSPPSHVISDLPGVSSAAVPTPISTPTPTAAATAPSLSGVFGHFRAVAPTGTPRHSNSPIPISSALAPAAASLQSASSSQPPGQRAHPLSRHKVSPRAAADAPGTGTATPSPLPASGFPSPGRDHVHTQPKFIEDLNRITYAIQQSIPEAVRRSVRDNWEKCTLGSDFHQAFILNASIHHASPAAVQRGIRDFGKSMILAARNEIVHLMTTADLDHLATAILAKASDSFLDKALEQRLRTIEAKRLINALARAERLGYDPSDIEEEGAHPPAAFSHSRPQPSQQHHHQQQQHQQQQHQQQHHQQQHQQQHQQHAPAAGPPAHTGPSSVSPDMPPALPMHCNICFRRFPAQSAYDYHVKGQVCTRSPSTPNGFKYNCQHCGQGFTTVMGLQYHNSNQVCGDFGEPAHPKPALASAQMPLSQPAPARAATPTVAKTASLGPGTPGMTTTDGGVSDPYAHLSPEQLNAMREELREAEIKFTERMRQASMIPDEAEKKSRLDALSNSFGTKQSLIRKKYGVRLRMRRTKAEIQAERDRMQYKTAAELQADIGISSNGPGRPPASSYRPASNNRTSAGANGWALVNQPAATTPTTTTTLASSLTVPKPTVEDDAGGVGMHTGKRRHSGDGELPSKRIAYSEMGGLSGAKTEAETMDPTRHKGAGTAEEPMALDDSDSDDSATQTADDDIPAQLPASVRQSLQRSSSSRPGSSSAM